MGALNPIREPIRRIKIDRIGCVWSRLIVLLFCSSSECPSCPSCMMNRLWVSIWGPSPIYPGRSWTGDGMLLLGHITLPLEARNGLHCCPKMRRKPEKKQSEKINNRCFISEFLIIKLCRECKIQMFSRNIQCWDVAENTMPNIFAAFTQSGNFEVARAYETCSFI